MDLARLRKQLSISFNKSELRNLCFDLDVLYENLPGDTIDDKARELVDYCNRHDLLPKLVELCRELRPHTSWSDELESVDCIILCGGYAKRLWPLTEDLSKVLLPVAGKPVLAHVLDFVQQSTKVHRVFISVNRKFVLQIRDFIDKYSTTLPTFIIEDPDANHEGKIGPVGALDFIAKHEKLREFLVLAGDNLFGFKLEDFLHFASSNINSSNAVFRFEAYASVAEYGVVKLDKDNKFLDFQEKERIPAYWDISTGCYFFRRQDVDLMPQYLLIGGNPDSPGAFLRWLTFQDRPLVGFPFYTYWYDVGTREKLIEANSHYLVDSRHGNIEGHTTIEGPVQIAKGATVRDSTVGPNVVIETGVTIKNSIVCDSLIMNGTEISTCNIRNSAIGPHSKIEGKSLIERFEIVCAPNTRITA